MQWGDAGLGDQGSLLGGGEIGRGVQRLGWEGIVFPQELEDSHYGWSKGREGGCHAARKLEEPTSEDSHAGPGVLFILGTVGSRGVTLVL